LQYNRAPLKAPHPNLDMFGATHVAIDAEGSLAQINLLYYKV
jgi:hypothetical protein